MAHHYGPDLIEAAMGVYVGGAAALKAQCVLSGQFALG